MILTAVVAVILGILVGYFTGVWHQSVEEIIPDNARSADFEIIQESKWEAVTASHDLPFIRSARMTDSECETIHNVALRDLIRPTSEGRKRASRHADRIRVDAVKIDRKTGEVVRILLKPGVKSRILADILRRAGYRVIIDPEPFAA